MTAHRNSSGKIMTADPRSGCGFLCLAVFLTIAIMLVAGCTDHPQGPMTGSGSPQNEQPASGTGTIPAIIEVPTEPATGPSTPFITINPIGTKNTGDLIIINGTTNLPPRTSVYLKEINQSTGESTMIANTIACPDAGGVNRWSFALDSTAWMKPGGYRYMVSTPDGMVNTSVQFALNGEFTGPASTLYYKDSKDSTIRGTGAPSITVNPIGDRRKGEIFLISGTTNLVEGTVLDCTVWPIYYEDPSKKPKNISSDPCEGQYNMIGYSTLVVNGTGDTNSWSFPADMTRFPENTTMIVHVSTTNEDLTERGIYGNSTFYLA
jgi:hypothetical protein